jgi:hypothetical protein
MSRFSLLVAALAVVAQAPLIAATVAPLEGPQLTPVTVQLQGDRLRADGAVLPLAELDWLELDRPAPPREPAPASFGIWLTDGSWLPASALAAAEGDRIRATTPFGTHDVPLTAIAGWGATEPALAADGLDRVMVASGPLDGRLRGLKDGKLSFATNLDPEPLALDLAEVQGLRLAQPTVAPSGTSLLAIADPQRPPVRLISTAEGLRLAASGQAVSGISGLRLRVDGGRRRWLSDLTPATVDERGAFKVVWPWQRDHDLDGGPLLLGGVRYAKGISVHSAATLEWNLGGGYVRLRALVGIADLVAPEGDCTVALFGDGKDLWHRDRVRGGEPPLPLDLDLHGVQRLELKVGLGERYDIGDHLTLADAYLVTAAKAP